MDQNATKKSALYGLKLGFNYLTEEDYSRENSENLWDDLWTNIDQYDKEVKQNNSNYSIQKVYKWIENPIIPSPIVVFGWFDLLEKTDYPCNNLNWKIFSKRLLSIAFSLGVELKTHPLRVLERAKFSNVYSENVRKYENIIYDEISEYRDDWFYGVQLPMFSITSENWNAFDTENINWLESTEPPPAFFVDPKSPSEILITSQAREALEKAEIKGIRFTEPFGI
jgi:hypothetical protein